MNQAPRGVGGEITAEIFETLFPDIARDVLLDFLASDREMMFVIVRLSEVEVITARIDRNYAQGLLNEMDMEEK